MSLSWLLLFGQIIELIAVIILVLECNERGRRIKELEFEISNKEFEVLEAGERK